jgi:fermentation-respiration switch protein FrsA (DUF1100 family)
MTLSALGIFSAAGAGGVVAAGSYELISTTLLSSNASSVAFSGLGTYSSTYKHLQIRAVGRSSGGTIGSQEGDAVLIRLNGDSGSNYAQHVLYGNGASVISGAASSQTAMAAQRFTDSTGTANAFGGFIATFLDPYSTTKNKTMRTMGGSTNQITLIAMNSGLWMNTASVTSITLTPNVGANFNSGTRFSLYGIR